MYERRLRGLLIAYCVLLGALGARAFALQVLDTGKHRAHFEKDLNHTFTILPRRGEILFADGSPMAWNEPGFSLEVAFNDLDDRLLPTADELVAGFRDQERRDAAADARRIAAAPTERERKRVRANLTSYRKRQRERRASLVRDLPDLRDVYFRRGLRGRWECDGCGTVVKSAQPPEDDCRLCGRDDAYVLLEPLDLYELAVLLTDAKEVDGAEDPRNAVESGVVTLQAAFANALRRYKARPEYRLHALLLKIPANAAEQIALRPRHFAGFEARPRRARGYHAAAQGIAGNVRLPSAEDLRELTDKSREARGEHLYTSTEVYQSLLGSSGLEQRWDLELRGVPGRGHRELEWTGERGVKSVITKEVVDGTTLRTTIRADLQELAMDVVEQAPPNGHGAAVVIDVRTGAVLAIASTDRDGMDHARSYVLPGSVFKLITAVAWLESGHAPSEMLECVGSAVFRGRGRYKCMHTDGWIPFEEAFVVSCNGFFAQAAMESGKEALVAAYWRLGLEKRHDLAMGMHGTSPAGLEHTHPQHEHEALRWEPWDLSQIGIGQGKASATPLQIVTAYARVAAGGKLLRPFILERERPVPGSIAVDPVLARYAPLIRNAARLVVHDPEGTANRESLIQLNAAGKTGTAEVRYDRRIDPPMADPPKFLNNAWFVGYAPHDAPRVAAVVVYERKPKGRYGAAEAGDPVARLLTEALREQ